MIVPPHTGSPGRRRAALGVIATGSVLAALTGGAPPAVAATPQAVNVEFTLTADKAKWRPNGHRPGGRLVLKDIDPRMLMMAAAPRDEVAEIPASLLGASWKRIFKPTGGKTNAVVSVVEKGRPRLYAVRLKLVGRHRTGKRMTFAVTRLRHTAHSPRRLGRRARSWENATVLIDPTITDSIKAMWAALLDFFAGSKPQPPPNPLSRDEDEPGRYVFHNGLDDPLGEPVFHGPFIQEFGGIVEWANLQEQILNESGQWSGELMSDAGVLGSIAFNGSAYDGLALFGWGPKEVSFAPADGRVVLTNSAFYDVGFDKLSFEHAEIGGANMRGLSVGSLNVSNTVFEGVDATGMRTRGGTFGRSTITNSAFVDVVSGREVLEPSGKPDFFSDEDVRFNDTDFVSVLFKNVDLRGATLDGATLQGCSLQTVNLTGADIAGTAPSRNDGRFEPTFENSILEDVKFDGATLQNVSFAGVDFSSGDVSFDGATLNNVDFTGAVGLQFIDWTKVTATGNVYGLEEYGHQLGLEDRDYLRSVTFDGRVPDIDPKTGFDVEPFTGYLIDPASGVRFDADGRTPIDPSTGEPMRDPRNGTPLEYRDGELLNPRSGEHFDVDYRTGELVGER